MKYFVSRHARMQAHARLGAFPPPGWWDAVVLRISQGELRGREVSRGRRLWRLDCISTDGAVVSVKLLTVMDEGVLYFVTLYVTHVDGVDVREAEAVRDKRLGLCE